jgi:hypothetical protein
MCCAMTLCMRTTRYNGLGGPNDTMSYQLTNTQYIALLEAAGALWGVPLESPFIIEPVVSAIIDGEAL